MVEVGCGVSVGVLVGWRVAVTTCTSGATAEPDDVKNSKFGVEVERGVPCPTDTNPALVAVEMAGSTLITLSAASFGGCIAQTSQPPMTTTAAIRYIMASSLTPSLFACFVRK